MIKNSWLIFIIMIISCSATQKMDNWYTLDFNVQDYEQMSFSHFVFADSLHSLLLGSKTTDEQIKKKDFAGYNSVICYSEDGGTKWSTLSQGPGKYDAVCVAKKKIFSARSMNDEEETTILECSDDYGKSWQARMQLKKFYTRDIFFIEDTLFVIGKNMKNGYWSLMKSIDQG